MSEFQGANDHDWALLCLFVPMESHLAPNHESRMTYTYTFMLLLDFLNSCNIESYYVNTLRLVFARTQFVDDAQKQKKAILPVILPTACTYKTFRQCEPQLWVKLTKDVHLWGVFGVLFNAQISLKPISNISRGPNNNSSVSMLALGQILLANRLGLFLGRPYRLDRVNPVHLFRLCKGANARHTENSKCCAPSHLSNPLKWTGKLQLRQHVI